MKEVVHAYMRAVEAGASHLDGVTAGARSVADDPWQVVHLAGALARCKHAVAERDVGLTESLAVVSVDARTAMIRVPEGCPFPFDDSAGRRRRGAFDTPQDLARRLVSVAISGCDGPPKEGLDPACGTGAFLVAMVEAGVPTVKGTDLDPLALAVARVAAPQAVIELADGLAPGPTVDLVCANPPYVPPERQDKQLRQQLRERFPWLKGRFDLVIPFAAAATERVRAGGGLGLVLPTSALVQNYGAQLRREWVSAHRFIAVDGPHPFPGASVDVALVALQMGHGPAPLPANGIMPGELLRLENCPLNPALRPGDVALVEQIRQASVPLRSMAMVDTGLVAHGPDGGKARLLHDQPGGMLKPYADAREFFAGNRRWIDYQPERMHRAKSPELFERPKVVVQRLRGRGPVRADIDRDGVYVGHTCTVVSPNPDSVPIERLLDLIRSPIVDALTRITHGQRLDLYPKDVGAFPVPKVWQDSPEIPLAEAYGLDEDACARLEDLAAR